MSPAPVPLLAAKRSRRGPSFRAVLSPWRADHFERYAVRQRFEKMPVTYRLSAENIRTRELEELFAAAGLDGRVGDKIRRAFLSSSLVCLAYDEDRLVGASRAITDGEYHGLIYDVAVHPDYQQQGIGRHMMKDLLDRLPVWRVMLVADGGVQEFYRRFGFGSYPDVMARLDRERLRAARPGE